ncbi:hypothetical protein UlMin_025270, partial [Ulmus minor]
THQLSAHLYTIIKVARDEDLLEQIGKNIFLDLVDHDKVRRFPIQKQIPFYLFKEEIAKEFGVPVQCQRFWLWAKRQNHTYRLKRPLSPFEEAQSIGQLREGSKKADNAELNLFLEVEFGLNLRPVAPPVKTKKKILLFFKLYDPVKEELRYIGRLFVKRTGKPVEILTKLNEMAGFSADEQIELFEEIRFEPKVWCEPIDNNVTFRSSELVNGDIVCFQKSPQPGSSEHFRHPDVPSFLEYVHNRQIVRFRSMEKPKEDEFCLELSKLHTYDDVVERVAQHLGLDDPSKIRLTSHNYYSQQPKPQPIKYRGLYHLSDMLLHYNQTSDILYYEILDIPLPELQDLKTLEVAFHHATRDEVVIHTVRLPKQSTVGDVINDLKTKVELSHPNAEIRLLEVFYHKIYKIFPLHEKIENINDQYWTLRAEEIPEEEKDFSPPDLLIHVYHFMKDTTHNHVQIQNFGEPFFLVIREHETLAEVKARIQKKLQVPHEEFAKWKFAFMSLGRPEYLQDNDIVASRFQRRDLYGAWEQYLGLEHTDNAPKRSYTANQSIVGISINQIPEKSAPLAIAEKRSDQVTLVAKDIVNAQVGTPVTFLTKSSLQLKEPTLMANNTREGTETAICPPAHQVVAEADSSSFAKFDAMFAGIQNLLEGKNSEAESSDSFRSPLLSIEEISNAKRTFKQCLGQNLTNVIKLGLTQEFMNSLSVMLTANAIPNNLVEELGWFLSNFDQSCDLYMAAKQDIVEVEEKENSVDDLKQLYHRFMPIRNEAASVDEEIAELERQLTEKKAKKAMLQSSLEDLARQAATSRETVIDAELDMKLNRMRKKQAEKTVVDMERSWESLKAGSSPFLL